MSKKNKRIIKLCGVKHEIFEDSMTGNIMLIMSVFTGLIVIGATLFRIINQDDN